MTEAEFLGENVQGVPGGQKLEQKPMEPFIENTGGVHLRKVLFTKRQVLPQGVLGYKAKIDLGDGFAVYVNGLTQTEMLDMQARVKPLEAGASTLEKESAALVRERNYINAKLERVEAKEIKASPEEIAESESRLDAISDRLKELSSQILEAQMGTLPVIDDLLKAKIVAVEWKDGENIHRSTDSSDVLDDLELKMQISGALLQTTSSGTNPFLGRR